MYVIESNAGSRENARVHPTDPITYVTLVAMSTPLQIQLTRIGLQPFAVSLYISVFIAC